MNWYLHVFLFAAILFVCRLHAVCQPATRVTVNRQLDP